MCKKHSAYIRSVQKINTFKTNCSLRKLFLTKRLAQYGFSPVLFGRRYTTKYVSSCMINGTYKKTLKIYKFNRHLVRLNSIKSSFTNINTPAW